MDITLLLVVRATYIWCCSLCTFRSWWTAQRQRTRCDNTNSALSSFAALCNKSICCDYVDLTVSDLPFPPNFGPWRHVNLALVAECTRSYILWDGLCLQVYYDVMEENPTVAKIHNSEKMYITSFTVFRSLYLQICVHQYFESFSILALSWCLLPTPRVSHHKTFCMYFWKNKWGDRTGVRIANLRNEFKHM